MRSRSHFFADRVVLTACAWIAMLLPVTGVLAQGGPPPPPPPLGAPPVPSANLLTPAKINLGHALFWEEQLSLTGTVACGTCHRPSGGGGDPRTSVGGDAAVHPGPDANRGTADDIHASPGVPVHSANGSYSASALFGLNAQVGTRNANSTFTAAYSPRSLFWDGRAGSAFLDPQTGAVLIPQDAALENQALGPLVDTSEMAHAGATLTMVVSRLNSARPLALATDVPAAVRDWINSRSYPALFQEAFGTPEPTAAKVAMAIASYERTLNPTQTPFDAQNGGAAALTQQEQQGAQVFQANQCAGCHSGALLSDNNFRYIGVRPVNEDLGRFNITNNPPDRGAFRVPSLRNVALSAPYMHTGRFATLEEVVEFYNRGGDFTAPNKDPRIIPRNLTAQQKAALVAFLRRPLTDPRIAAESGPFARPTLYTESTRAATIIGAGTPGSGGLAPLLTAIEPPVLGNQNFTVVLSRALGGATARLVVSSSDPGVQATVPTADFATIEVTADADGLASAQLRIPYRSTLLGQTLFGRFYVNDPAAANGLAVSPAFRITLFGNADIVMADAFD